MKQKHPLSPNIDVERKTLPAACICCGGDIQVCWEKGDGVGREMALVADVCPACWQADCTGLSVFLPDEQRHCNVLKGQARPTAEVLPFVEPARKGQENGSARSKKDDTGAMS